MDLMYLIGEPGVGKSTLMAALTEWGNQSSVEVDQPFRYRVWSNGVVELGGRREGYPGTDALALDASPRVVDFLRFQRPELVMGEGARLGTEKFLLAAQSIGYELHLYHLVGPARSRRREREKPQKESYAKGQRTKSAHLSTMFGALDISTTMSPDFLVKMMNDPVSMAFKP